MNKFAIGTIVAAFTALFGVGAMAAYENHQTNKKIGISMDELKNSTVRDISESLVKEAVTRAADLAVDKYIDKDNKDILDKAESRIRLEVNNLVSSRYNEAVKEVSDRISAQVARMDDPDRMKREIQSQATKILISRFEDDLNDLKKKAKDAFDEANDKYEKKLDDISETFEDKLDDKLEDYSEHLASMKKISDILESTFGSKRGDRDGKEIRFTLG